MSDVAIIGDIDTVTGFKLGGVKKGIIVNNDEEAKNALDEQWLLRYQINLVHLKAVPIKWQLLLRELSG